jgi:hypothetical protein
MRYGLNKYDLKVVDGKSRDGISSDGAVATGCHVIVYDAGTKTKSTIYSDDALTAKTNDITRTQFATDGGISFFSTAESHDVLVAHSDGSNTVETITPTIHTIVLDRSSIEKCLIFPMVFNAGGTEVDTGLDLPLGALVHDVAVEVTTADATETVNIGLLSTETNGDVDGFAALVSVASTGYVPMLTVTAGGTEDFLASTGYGALLASFTAGANVAGDVGTYARKKHFVSGSNATSVVYQPSTSDTFAGYGYLYFTRLR